MKLSFDIHDLRSRINWIYFEYAWGVVNADEVERQRLRADAEAMLDSWEGHHQSHALLLRLPANSDGDDILVGENLEHCLPMLRQQTPEGKNGTLLSLADFIRPLSKGVRDEIGVFCTTMDFDIENTCGDDPYAKMLAQTLADRLAEATAECISDEMPGIRPAVGYPSMPDMSMNFLLDEILDMKQVGIHLTSSGMMLPHASVSGLIFPHPAAHYFNIQKIGDDQLRDYAQRRGMTLDEVRKFIRL